ncbi:Ribosomal protein S18 acetylase RimI [Parasphingorhabdus marina DSM 22363]|uniref:Ribosomal protein S18 acetylase RimI n=1 Tax=Parasphingorhabdus marina DSM 22363 TaxID=1123272 RepID=A0A1N6D6C6_9SPHN|nr:GNAT family N-acetyltransferase [Parasphingorhabdus marina]SIN66246.1 Ribosomal protein S18 acetylase RimI [Parasphingorhabdus marina DSM 22363]
MSYSPITIRPFAEADMDRVQDIRAAAFKPVFGSFRDLLGDSIAAVVYAGAEAEQADHLDQVCDPDSRFHICVATVDDRVAGFCSWSVNSKSKVGQIGLNAVHPHDSGQGIGTALYNHALGQMKEAGMLAVTVGTGGDASHAPARRAYQKAGFAKAIPSLLYCQRL